MGGDLMLLAAIAPSTVVLRCEKVPVDLGNVVVDESCVNAPARLIDDAWVAEIFLKRAIVGEQQTGTAGDCKGENVWVVGTSFRFVRDVGKADFDILIRDSRTYPVIPRCAGVPAFETAQFR